ncbi:hypothetical protein ACHAWF_014393 [Thalassiosira exigua]
MARGRHSHGGGGGGALLACNRAIERRSDYEKQVKSLQARTKMVAGMLRPDDTLAEILKDWLASTRDRVRAIAEGNAKRMYEIEYFVDAVKEVRAEVQQNQNNAGGAEEEGKDNAAADAPDYERSINEAVDRVRQRGENDPSRIAVQDHEWTLEVRREIGEKIQKKSRESQGGEDDEDDLEIVHNRVDDVNALKCPITENPLKNKQCGHTYDRAGLNQLLGARKHTCPVLGCSNNSEEDEEIKLKR